MKDSAIAWTHHTFNPWWGCFKVSDGCKHCYADTLAKRFGHDIWGPPATTSRRMMSAAYWKQPKKWNAEAAQLGERRRVFCASMADVFEDHPQVVDAREQLFDVIRSTPWLDWLLLTKRPENIYQFAPDEWLSTRFPSNVWLGTSVENQEQADARIPQLVELLCDVHFLSCEPLLGPVDLSEWINIDTYPLAYNGCGDPVVEYYNAINWVIVGGESGHGHREMDLDWARSLRDQCLDAEEAIPFFFKQVGGATSKAGGHLLDGIEHFSWPEVSRHG